MNETNETTVSDVTTVSSETDTAEEKENAVSEINDTFVSVNASWQDLMPIYPQELISAETNNKLLSEMHTQQIIMIRHLETIANQNSYAEQINIRLEEIYTVSVFILVLLIFQALSRLFSSLFIT